MVKSKSMYAVWLSVILLFVLAAGCAKTDGPQTASAPGNDQDALKVAKGDGPLQRIKSKGKLVVGVKTDYNPFGYIDEKGNNVGFEIEMAKALAQDLLEDANKIEFVSVTGTNRISYLQSGKIDLILATMSITEERAKEVDFSEPYFKSGVQLLVKADSTIQDVADLKGKKVIVVPGSTGDLGIAKQVPDAELVKLQKTSESVQALKDGRADAFAQDNTLLYPLAGSNPEFKVVGKPFAELPWAIAVRKGESELVDWINANLKKWEDQDYFYELSEQWIAPNMPKEFNPSDFLRRPKK
ncbi:MULTISPECIES: transporter substrate-binding domain-containing protein [unclassified Paenibacillus]|uniref:transporter substrate-binding domain-containing protein n=1 Tax=unclassified Paenibacillus TaxID=185978 RepID=UPI002119452D|nr:MULTISPECIES: transporter substrate-binding domain-containing protein [unclassified Paenibacillus]